MDIDRAREMSDDYYINREATYTQEEYSELEDKIEELEMKEEELEDKLDYLKEDVIKNIRRLKMEIFEFKTSWHTQDMETTRIIANTIKLLERELEIWQHFLRRNE